MKKNIFNLLLLFHTASIVENPENFMEKQGYEKAEKVNIEEKQITSSGPRDEGLDSVDTSVKQVGQTKTTYAKPEEINTKSNVLNTSVGGSSTWNTIETSKYTLIKPVGQSNNVTSTFNPTKSFLNNNSFWMKVLCEVVDTFIIRK